MHDIIEKKYLDQLPYILGAGTLFVVTCVLASAQYHARGSRPTTPPEFDSVRVVMFETAGCPPCDDFRKSVGKPHQSSPLNGKISLSYFDVTDGQPPKRFKISGEVDGGTAVVFDVYGREAARMGIPKTLADFQNNVMPHVRRAERDLQYAAAR